MEATWNLDEFGRFLSSKTKLLFYKVVRPQCSSEDCGSQCIHCYTNIRSQKTSKTLCISGALMQPSKFSDDIALGCSEWIWIYIHPLIWLDFKQALVMVFLDRFYRWFIELSTFVWIFPFHHFPTTRKDIVQTKQLTNCGLALELTAPNVCTRSSGAASPGACSALLRRPRRPETPPWRDAKAERRAATTVTWREDVWKDSFGTEHLIRYSSINM